LPLYGRFNFATGYGDAQINTSATGLLALARSSQFRDYTFLELEHSICQSLGTDARQFRLRQGLEIGFRKSGAFIIASKSCSLLVREPAIDEFSIPKPFTRLAGYQRSTCASS
jgi:hypothetical protein